MTAGRRFTIPAQSDARVPQTLLARVLLRDGLACVYCGVSGLGVALHVDHARSLAHSPASTLASVVNAPSNLVTACAACNAAKGPQDLPGFARMLRRRGVAPGVVRAMIARTHRAARRPY